MIRRTSRTNWARAEDVGSAVVFPVRMTKDLGILGSAGFSVFLTCVRFLLRFFAISPPPVLMIVEAAKIFAKPLLIIYSTYLCFVNMYKVCLPRNGFPHP